MHRQRRGRACPQQGRRMSSPARPSLARQPLHFCHPERSRGTLRPAPASRRTSLTCPHRRHTMCPARTRCGQPTSKDQERGISKEKKCRNGRYSSPVRLCSVERRLRAKGNCRSCRRGQDGQSRSLRSGNRKGQANHEGSGSAGNNTSVPGQIRRTGSRSSRGKHRVA
jgi:hypothetical protein